MEGTYADITDVACDIVIIGAGVIGCAAAYNLAKKGRSVTVLDREPNVGEGASSRNGGGVRQSGRDGRELPLAMYAVENIWPTLSDELGADVEYVKRGNLRLGKTEEHLQTLRKLASMSQGLGLDMKMIGPRRCARSIRTCPTRSLAHRGAPRMDMPTPCAPRSRIIALPRRSACAS